MNKSNYVLLFHIILLFHLPVTGQDIQLAPFELSEGTESADYEETINYFKILSDNHSSVSMLTMGKTDSGYPLHLVVYNSDGFSGFENLKNSGKLKILVMNAIHPGEPDGVDASMMLLRDLAGGKYLIKETGELIFMIIPFYNIGGALNRGSYSRANQNGPREYGFRGNSKNLDLNRDFIKMESENSRSFARLFHLIDPDIFIDTHVTNGADYSYYLTYIETQPDHLGGQLGPFIRDEFSPALERSMQDKNKEIIPYVNIFGRSPNKGYTQFVDYPRYSTGYCALFRTISYVVETHMLKPFKERVIYTQAFLESVISEGVRNKFKIKELRARDRLNFNDLNSYPIRLELDSSRFRTIWFTGYDTIIVKSQVSGNPVMKYDRNKPFTKDIPYYCFYSPSKTVSVPEAYIIPQAWTEVIDLLDMNKISYHKVLNDSILHVQQYHIRSYQTYDFPYEGHYPHYNTEVEASQVNISFRKGDLWVPTSQPGIRYLLETLEPEAPDSFFNWNFFDSILLRKEYFSTYIFDEKAAGILEGKPWLRDSLENKRNRDPEFETNTRAQLEYIYINSEHYERELLRYPVFRYFNPID